MRNAIICTVLIASTLAFAQPIDRESYYIKAYDNQYVCEKGEGFGLCDESHKTVFTVEIGGTEGAFDVYYLRLPGGSYVSSLKKENNASYGAVAPKPRPMGWEAYWLKENGSGKYFIESIQWKTHLRANSKDNIIDQTNERGESEAFEFIKADVKNDYHLKHGQSYFIKASDGRYVYFDRDGFGLGNESQRTLFTAVYQADKDVRNKFYLKLPNGSYVSALPTANALGAKAQPAGWEAFWIENERGVNYSIQSVHWKSFLRANLKDGKLDQTGDKDKNGVFEFIESDATPKIVWGFWDRGEAALPAFNKYNVNHWRKLLEPAGYQIRILNIVPGDKDNAITVLGGQELLPTNFDKIETLTTSYIVDKTRFDLDPRIVKSDCIRLATLEKFGGIWMDTSNALIKSLDDIIVKDLNKSPRTVAGYIMAHLTSPNSPIVDGERVDGMENWFIVAKKGSPLIHEWRKAFSHYWETRKPGEWIEHHPMYQDPGFSFGGSRNQERLYANYLNQHAALKWVLFHQPALGQEIYPIKKLDPWWLHDRAKKDKVSIYDAATKGDLESKVAKIQQKVGLLKFASSNLGDIKKHFPNIEDFCTKPNIFHMLYKHCP